MTNVTPLRDSQRRRDQATAWIARMDRQLTPAEIRELKIWMAADERNERELQACARLWDMLGALESLRELTPRENKQSVWWPAAVAAALVLATTLLLVPNDLLKPSNPQPQDSKELAEVVDQATYTTPVGDNAVVHLNDGSVVQLNTDTRLQVRMTPDQRLLTLEQGEIHIDVARDLDRPLRVRAGKQVLEAVGTSFNVRIDETRQVELIVTEGRVRVQLPAESFEVADSDTTASVLEQGERVLLDEVGEVQPLADEEVEMKLAWRDGMLVFRGSSLVEAVREVGRYTHLEFLIQSDDLKDKRIAGVFRAGDVEGFLASLRENFDVVDRQIDDGTISLSLKRSPSSLEN
ncbi:MAG: FecR domain-containing protein [Pseudomonadota bacterium]